MPDETRKERRAPQVLATLAGVLAAVSRHKLVAALRPGPCDCRYQYAVFLDTLHGIKHGLIVQYLERVIFERKKLVNCNLPNLLAGGRGGIRGKNIIVPLQFYLFVAAFQFSSPPLSVKNRHLPLCRQGHRQKYSFLRHSFRLLEPNAEYPAQKH